LSKKAITRTQAAITIVIIVLAIGAGAYFASRPGPTGPTQSQTSAQVPHPDTITEETIGQPDTVDPASDYETSGGEVMWNVYERLLFFNGADASQTVPWLATGYDLSPDGLTYTFHLRSGITFTDGTPFNATAVYFSIMRDCIMDDPDGPAWIMLQVMRGGANYSKQYNNAGPSAPGGYGDKYTQAELQDFLNAKPMEIIDPMTIAIHLERPYAGWPTIMVYPLAIYSPTAFIAHWTAPTDGTPYIPGATAGDYHGQYNPWPNTNAVGTGPYMLQSWDKASQTVVLVRNEHYWGGPAHRGIAPTPTVIIHGIDDANTRVLDCKAGTADICSVPVTGGLIFQFIDQNAWFNTGKMVPLSPDYAAYPQCPPADPIQGKCLFPQFITNYIGLNELIKGPDMKPLAFQPFADVRIRKAFTLAFNRTSYIHDVGQNFAIPASQIIPPGMFGYDPSITPSPNDPAQVKALLLDAGANPITPANAFSPKNPQTITISYNLGNLDRETAATILANTINGFSSETGLFATVSGLAWPQFLHASHNKQLSMFLVGWVVDYVDPDDFLVPFAYSEGTLATRIAYHNPQVDKLVLQQPTITDRAQRLATIKQIQTLVNNDYAYIWRSYGAAWTLARSWMHERANASIASTLQTDNAAISGYYYYEIQKGTGSSAPSAQLTQPGLLDLIQLPAISSFILKKSF